MPKVKEAYKSTRSFGESDTCKSCGRRSSAKTFCAKCREVGCASCMREKCNDCGEVHHYPRALCPFCFSEKVEWLQAKGTAEIYTYSVMRRAPIPYAIAYVTLQEGVSMMTNIVDCDLDKIRIGQPVKLVFKPSDGGPPVPMFAPV